jgi:hypothetical protein
LADPEFLAQASKLKLDITYVSGEESEQLVNQVLSVTPKVRENLGYISSVK